MPSQINPRSGPFPVYSSASPPTSDVGFFTIAKTGIDFKAAATVTIFTVPTGRTYLVTNCYALVTAVNQGGVGTENWQIKESSSARSMIAAYTSASHTPVANQSVYANPATGTGVFSTCTAGNSVQAVISTSHAGSTGVTGTIYLTGFYTS